MLKAVLPKALVALLVLCSQARSQTPASSSSTIATAFNSSSSFVQTLVLLPGTKWTRCFSDGRLNVDFSVNSGAAGKVHSGLALPAQAAECRASKPFSCKWLRSCHAAASCKRFFPGEMSGREKCLVVMNSAADEQEVELNVQLQSPGNWGAIIFGVVASSCGLLFVVAAGCYSDVSALLANSRSRKQAIGSCRSSKAG